MKHRPFAEALRRALHRWEDPEKQGRKALDVIAAKLVQRACDGDRIDAIEIANRLDGKPHQSLDATITHQDSYEQMSDAELAQRIAELQARLDREQRAQAAPSGGATLN